LIEVLVTTAQTYAADPAALTPADRLRQIAAILARGVMRIRRLPPAETAQESGDPGLELPTETVLSVTRG